MKKDEGVREYALAVKELASRGAVEDDALIHYTNRGISDEESNKGMLYGVTKYSEFKERLKAYERMKRAVPDQSKQQKVQRIDSARKTCKDSEVTSHKKAGRCFCCGEIGHRSKECPKKALGVKCFKCENYGHVAENCDKDVKNFALEKTCNLVSSVTGKCEKDVIINDIKMVALVDLGSDITLIREEQYNEIGRPEIKEREMQFRGAGVAKFQTLSGAQVDISIDDEVYSISAQVVSNEVLRNGLILGTDFLNTVVLNIKQGVITITKISEDEKDVPDAFRIDAIEREEIDLDHVKDENIRKELTELIQSYTPHKTKETSVKMRIVLTDNIPAYQRAPRLAEEEKNQVEAQVNRWLQARIIRPLTADYSSPVVPTRKKDGTIRRQYLYDGGLRGWIFSCAHRRRKS